MLQPSREPTSLSPEELLRHPPNGRNHRLRLRPLSCNINASVRHSDTMEKLPGSGVEDPPPSTLILACWMGPVAEKKYGCNLRWSR
ncbi:hypothetical protein PM082_009721 [Marasmius tenuissimus]|nr:hypothetical protein PM082_009721 [Marasmius tenuissimus]